MLFWTVEDAGPKKENGNILMIKSLSAVFLFYFLFSIDKSFYMWYNI